MAMIIRPWYEITPQDAVELVLPRDDVRGPLTTDGRPCPWPWDPIRLAGAPLGQYHCPFCGEMVVAGMHHVDYRDEWESDTQRRCPSCMEWHPLDEPGREFVRVRLEEGGDALGEVCVRCAVRLAPPATGG